MTTNTMTATNTTVSSTATVNPAVQNPDFFINDASEKAFKEGEYQELVDFCKWDASKTEWLDEGIRDILFEASYDEPLCAPEYAKKLKVSEEAILDTQQHAGLNLTTSIGKKPVGESATRNICSRAMIGMNCYELLRKNNRGSLKEVLNLILAERKGTTRIKFSHEKIRAVHSGRYAAISNDELLEIMDEYMAQNWPDHEFISAYVSHELMQVVIDLSAYKQQFFRKLPPELCRGYAPAVVMISSDVAESAVRLIPAFNTGGVIAPMAKEVAIPHIGDNIEDRVRNAFTALLAYFDDAATDISKLSTIPINYGKATLVRVLTKYGMPKEESREALAAYDMWHASGNVTAMDIYLSVCEAYAAVVRNHAQDAKKIFTAADCVARCARTLWSTMDMPGKEDM